MKHSILLIICLLFVLPCAGQSYLAYTVYGDVSVKKGKKAVNLAPGDSLTRDAVLTIGGNGKAVLLSESEQRMITLKAPGTGTVATLAGKEGNRTNDITKSYIAFVKEKMVSGDKAMDVNYMQAAGTSYRGIGYGQMKLTDIEEGKLLQPLRNACSDALAAFLNGDSDGLARTANRLDSLGMVRYAFETVSEYKPHSFNGHLVFDPLCLRDLAASLDPAIPFVSQIEAMPVPVAATTRNLEVDGNILVNYYFLDAGEEIVLTIDCLGYCEVAALSENENVTVNIDGVDNFFVTYDEASRAVVRIANPSCKPAVILFAINAE